MATVAAYARPGRLHRFRPLRDETIDDELAALTDGYVFCPRFDEMNDPMEGGHRVSALLRDSRSYRTTIAAVQARLGEVGIASFSEVFDHEPMWAHYAGHFAGMCVAYSFRRLLASLPDDHELVRMTYSEEPPILLRNDDDTDARARLILSTKTLRWSPEREWRLITPSRGPARYGRLDVVTRVYLGARMSAVHRASLLGALRRARIPAYDMRIEEYEIGFRRLLFRPRPPATS